MFEAPYLISNAEDFEAFLEAVIEEIYWSAGVGQKAVTQYQVDSCFGHQCHILHQPLTRSSHWLCKHRIT